MKIGVLTSGGDAPGMNAALRTIAVVGIARGHQVLGVRRGYEGLLAGDVTELTLDAVEGISRFGGTMLGSARSAEFPRHPSRSTQETTCSDVACSMSQAASSIPIAFTVKQSSASGISGITLSGDGSSVSISDRRESGVSQTRATC